MRDQRLLIPGDWLATERHDLLAEGCGGVGGGGGRRRRHCVELARCWVSSGELDFPFPLSPSKSLSRARDNRTAIAAFAHSQATGDSRIFGWEEDDEPLARTPAFFAFSSALALPSSPPFPSRNGYSRGPASRSHARATRTGPDTRERFTLRARDRDCTRLRSQIHLALLAPSQARLRKAIGRSHLRGRSQDPPRQGFGAGTAGGHLR